MELLEAVNGVWGWAVLAGLTVVALAAGVCAPPWARWRADREVRQWLEQELDVEHGHCVHKLRLRLDDGSSVHLPHVVLTPHGVFALQTVHLSGGIWGREEETTWTQLVRHTRVSFPNPLRQSAVHVQALSLMLEVGAEHIHPVVVFTRPCKFKNPLPHQVVQGRACLSYIARGLAPVWSPDQLQAWADRLRCAPTLATTARALAPAAVAARTGRARTMVRPQRPTLVEAKTSVPKPAAPTGFLAASLGERAAPALAAAAPSSAQPSPPQCPECDSALLQLHLPSPQGGRYVLRCARWSRCGYHSELDAESSENRSKQPRSGQDFEAKTPEKSHSIES